MTDERKYGRYLKGIGAREPWDAGWYIVVCKGVELVHKPSKASSFRYGFTTKAAFSPEGEKHIGRGVNTWFSNSSKGDYFGMQLHLGFLVCAGCTPKDSYIDFEKEGVLTALKPLVENVEVAAYIEPDEKDERYGKITAFESPDAVVV